MRNNSPTSQRSNHLPLEIWLHIFLHACADGGYTGYSLTLVSKFFHHASQLVRFHSLAFTSLRRIEGFLAFAEHTTTIQAKKPKVHHLLLSFSRSPSHEASPEFGRSEDIYGANLPVADVWFRARQAREQEKASWDKRFVIVVSALLDLVGPHLETLALLQSDAFAIPPLRYRLPRLRELTLLMGITVILNEDLPGTNEHHRSRESAEPASSGAPFSRAHPHPHPSPISASASIPSSSPESRFEGPPSDGALSILGTRSLGYELEHAARARRFPALERLHIICGRQGVDMRGRAMPRLRRVVVHSILLPPDAQCATSHMGYRALSDAMKELLAACELAPDMRLQWRESERVMHQVWEDVCRARWVDRIEVGRAS